MTHSERMAQFARISTALALLSDPQLTRLVNDAEPLACGIGGTTLALELQGRKVFAKRIRLTDVERLAANQMSTANVFELPTYCQRNVGSVGFGAWRELAASTMATGWVISRQLESFPLMYHWRVLDGAAAAAADELADVEGRVRFWGGSEAMGVRLKALADATASVVIFLEYLPWNLSAWLGQQFAGGRETMESALEMVERGLTVDIPLMNALGLLHGDAHFGNILTDGQRLYFADLGLATSARVALSKDESDYLHDNASLDRAYALTKWVNWLIKAFAPTVASVQERIELVRGVARGQELSRLVPDLPSSVAAIIRRHAPIAAIVNDFYIELHGERRSAPYPRDDIEASLRAMATC